MPGARYVLLGLAGARSLWFRDVAQWANASSIPAEFLKCVSVDEVRARLAGGGSFSALLIDAGVQSLDRDLVETAQQAGCAVIVVDDRRGVREWVSLGANAGLTPGFDRKDLVDILATHSVMIGRVDRPVAHVDRGDVGGWQAPLAAVCGPGGTGTSTVAIALAQGLAADVRTTASVALADFALNGEQAMLHDAREAVPGVQELVDLFRSGRPTTEDIRSLAFAVDQRGYALLLGLRQRRAWSALRPRAFAAALDGLRRSYRAVVADVDADVEGEDEGGSVDVEERHTMARTTLAAADAVFVVGLPGMKGAHSLVRVVSDLLNFGVPSARLIPVFNRAPRASRGRAELSATFSALLPEWVSEDVSPPLYLPERRTDEALRDGVRLSPALAHPLGAAFNRVMGAANDRVRRPAAPERVVPGSIGSWAPDEAAEG
jgi:hypothetical protein